MHSFMAAARRYFVFSPFMAGVLDSIIKSSFLRHRRAKDAHSREKIDCRKRPRGARECAKAHFSIVFSKFYHIFPKGESFFDPVMRSHNVFHMI